MINPKKTKQNCKKTHKNKPKKSLKIHKMVPRQAEIPTWRRQAFRFLTAPAQCGYGSESISDILCDECYLALSLSIFQKE